MSIQLISYLNFNGNCEEAITFYKDILDGEIVTLMRYSDAPEAGCGDQYAEMGGDKIMHVTLKIGDHFLMASDCPPESYAEPRGTVTNIQVDDLEKAKAIFEALAVDAKAIQMNFEATFWAKGFGMLIDKFGTPWMVNGS